MTYSLSNIQEMQFDSQVSNWEDGISTSSLSEAEEKTIKAVYEQMKSLEGDNSRKDTTSSEIYETVRSEVRRAIAVIQDNLQDIGIRALSYRELGCISNMSNSDELRHTDNTTLVPPRLPDTLPQVYHRRRPTLGLLVVPSREEALTAYGTETGQNSVPVPKTSLTVCTTRLRGQLHTILEDIDHYPNACLEELEAFMILWDVKPQVEESSLETLSVDELVTQLRQMCEDTEDRAINA
ncbi:hypothetical protein Tco_0884801 [Tanacetum coccineum]